MVSPQLGIRPVRQVRSATNAPRTQTFGFTTEIPFGLTVENDTFLDQNAAVGPQLPGHDDCVGLFRALVKSMALNLGQRPVPALLLIDDFLEVLLDFGDLV